MVTRQFVPGEVRDAAVADYYASGDSIATVAGRHSIPRSTLGGWVKRGEADALAYVGGWEVRGGVRYPLLPERRSA